MKDVTLIGVDLAKRVFHLHGAAVDGSVVFRKKLSRVQFEHFVKCHPGCVVNFTVPMDNTSLLACFTTVSQN